MSQPDVSRVPWGSLSREQVIDEATAELREVGYERLTIRGLARRVGASPMSLYRHVRDKDDLVDEVVGRLLAQRWRPDVDPADSRAWLIEAADAFRRFLVDEPAALASYLRHPAASAAAIERMDTMVGVLRSVVGGEQQALHGYAALQTFSIGFAALETARQRAAAGAGRESENPDRTGRASGTAGSDSAEALVRARALDTYTTPESFRQGVVYLLDGIGLR